MTNNELIEKFLLEIKSKNYSLQIIESYENDLNTFKDFLGKKSILIIDKTILMDYINFLRDNFKNNTVIKKLNSFKGFYKNLAEKKMVSYGILEELKNFKNEYSIPEIISDEELDRLFSICCLNEKGKRDMLIIKIMLKTGMQLNKILELTALSVTDTSINFEKNNKKHLVKLDDELKKEISNYKNSSLCGQIKLFEGLTRQNFFARIKKYQRESGIEREINPVMLKNTAIYSFIEMGIPMRELKEQLDYVNIGMTGIYKIRNKSDIKRVYEKIGIGDWNVSKFD